MSAQSNLLPRIYVQTARTDGKFKVQYVFPITGTRTTKIITRAKLDDAQASGSYAVIFTGTQRTSRPMASPSGSRDCGRATPSPRPQSTTAL
jgi:hypothetical protein